MINMNHTQCIHCHRCRDNCTFLSKYNLDIGDADQLRELAYHCFLCGRCTSVCPVGIDGKAVMLGLRQERVRSGDKSVINEKYSGLVKEKGDYSFRNYRHATDGVVFFPGCNLPGMYPETTKELVRLFEEAGIGTVYDCCGKPISDIGLEENEREIIRKLSEITDRYEISELVVACPNCRAFLEGKLNVRLTGVYEKLAELGQGRRISHDVRFFVPCPDREDKVWIDEIKLFVDGNISAIDGPQCCGLGGCAAINEPELSQGFGTDVDAIMQDTPGAAPVYVYCASCGGKFMRSEIQGIDHILSEIIGVSEVADVRNAYKNRSETKEL